jgi:anaerobic C4-dicarboxylate transporter
MATLAIMVFLFGLVIPVVMMSINKTNGLWFSQRQLGLANGIVSMDLAIVGFLALLLVKEEKAFAVA